MSYKFSSLTKFLVWLEVTFNPILQITMIAYVHGKI